MVLQAGQAVYKSRIVCSGTLRKCQVEAIKQIFSRELEEPVFIKWTCSVDEHQHSVDEH